MVFISKNTFILAVTMFILGFLLSTALNQESRFALSSDTNALDSPSDWILDENLKVFTDKAVIEKQGLIWARIEDTHSMEPVLNKDTISLELPPSSPDNIQAGDIISFEQNNKIIIHRVLSIGEDSQGWFAITKGDNNQEPDPYKIRFSQIKGVVVGILY